MATCEELDQTVTDLTDDLHAKVRPRAAEVSWALRSTASNNFFFFFFVQE